LPASGKKGNFNKKSATKHGGEKILLAQDFAACAFGAH
jgi:hypothetical protein